MPYQGSGRRATVTATKACVHGQIVTESGFVGTAFKVEQVDRWTKPADANDIAEDEVFEIQLDGVHEAPASGAMSTAIVGDLIYINPTNNALDDAPTEAWLPVGVVEEVDALRTPDVIRISSQLNAFLPVPAAP